MHTRMELLFVHKDEKEASRLASSVEEMVNGQERIFSRHLSESPVSLLNRSEGSVEVGEELYFALELCERVRLATGGFFDIAALSGICERPAYITIPETHSVIRTPGNAVLDFGGYAKGFALEKAIKMLREAGVAGALLNFGNSSVGAVGTHPFGENWIVSPGRSPETVFPLRDSALSISGNGSSGRGHIINPRDGKVAEKDYDIAVTGKSAFLCEVLSTALFAAPENEMQIIISRFGGYEMKRIE